MDINGVNAKGVAKWVGVAIGIFFAIIIIVNLMDFFVVVGPGERGVLLQFGTIKQVYEPGLHFQVPILNNVVLVDVQTQKFQDEVEAASEDLQSIAAIVALNYHVDPMKVDQLYRQIGLDYVERIVKPAIQESVKAITAQYKAEELINERSTVKEDIKKLLIERLENYHVKVDDVSIVNFNFSEEFNRSIEAKQTAAQNALKAENDLRRIEIEAKQVIEKAKAEAESIRIQGEALRENQNLVQLKIVEKWDGKLPVYNLGNSTPLIQIPTNP